MASVFCSLMCLNEYGTSVEDIEILRFMMIRCGGSVVLNYVGFAVGAGNHGVARMLCSLI